jgi:ABC-type lipoprotein release transport system permease subunit
MKEYLKIAWRNLWRNKRRTLITMASILFAVFLALLMRSMQLGTYESMERNTIRNTTGYLQLHEAGYWEEKTINNTMADTAGITAGIAGLPNVSIAVPRLESFALGSSGIFSKGVVVIGTDPLSEDRASGLSKRVLEGVYLRQGDEGVLLTIKLAEFLKLKVGDTITLISQGYHGVTAAGIFPVRGIISFPSPVMNNKLLYMDLQAAQEFYGAPDRLTSISVMLHDTRRLEKDMIAIREKTGSRYEIMSWKEMNRELVQSIESDNISGMFMLGILYLVVGFGIFGTLLMMTVERKRELGIMVAVGMQRLKLALILFIETVYIGLTGIVAGTALAMPVLLILHHNPIKLTGEAARAMMEFNADPVLPFSLDPQLFCRQGLVILAITLISSLYPTLLVLRFNILKAIRGH